MEINELTNHVKLLAISASSLFYSQLRVLVLAEKTTTWYLYIIETDKGHLYTGITTDIERRFSEHLATSQGKGKGARYFRSQSPKRVVYSEQFIDRSTASKREAAVKKLSKHQKLTLISA